MIIKAGINNDQVTPPKLPMVQNVKLLNSESELINVKIPIPTEAIAFTAIPTSNIYVIPWCPNPFVKRNSIKMTKPDPRQAASGSKKVENINVEASDEPKTIIVEAPNAAPAETPIKPGSARGFLNKPCKQAPETDKLAPTIAAKITLGTLISLNIVVSIAVVFPVNIEKTGKL